MANAKNNNPSTTSLQNLGPNKPKDPFHTGGGGVKAKGGGNQTTFPMLGKVPNAITKKFSK
jgi:hypothetical protein